MAACRPITLEIQEAEARVLGVQGQLGQLCKSHLKFKKSKCLGVQLSGRPLASSHLAGQTQTDKMQNETKNPEPNKQVGARTTLSSRELPR